LVNGAAAPLFYVSGTQLSAFVPYALAETSKTYAELVVEFEGRHSAQLRICITSGAPGLFTADGNGSGQGAGLNPDGSLNSPENPAPAGAVVALFGTGAGQTEPAGVDGSIVKTTLSRPILPVSVTVGGIPAQVLYFGSAPGSIAGIFQANIRIPDGITSGSSAVLVKVGEYRSQEGVLVSVKRSSN
jgi:uncharacterized protein (TIGR03437 family)